MGASFGRGIGRVFQTSLAALALAGVASPAMAAGPSNPTVAAVPGKPMLLMGAYDLAPLGYQVEEYFISGTATSFSLPGAPEASGVWNAVPAASAPYVTRIVVVRPTDAAKFNGTVLVEWFNVTAGQDTPADWMVAHREMLRKGYVYVGVSAQKVGVEGGDAIMAQGSSLKKADPKRYGTLSHPGDAWSYDIFSQAGGLIKGARAGGVLGPLVPKHVIGIGESQSAAFLTTYVNAVDRLAKVYDGFLIHSRFGSAAALDGTRMTGAGGVPEHVRFRPDLRVPVLTVITETDLLGARLPGYHASRRADDRHLRVWEVAGTAHADNYLFMGAFIDSGQKSPEELAKVFVPSLNSPMGKLAMPLNPGMPHHYVVEAALSALNGWVESGRAPASTPVLELATGGKPGETPSLALDANGLAKGGVRTPWVDAPTIRLSGKGDPNSFIGMLGGSGVPMTKAELDKLYPQGRQEYLRRFTAALDDAIRDGHVLRDDRAEILAIAEINFGLTP
ncbi:MAG TPA: alpha/beta hydrolase domain-containing protein [Novosphingobium sp.]